MKNMRNLLLLLFLSLFMQSVALGDAATTTAEASAKPATRQKNKAPVVALFASPSRVGGLLTWLQSNRRSFEATSFLAPQGLKVLLNLDPRTSSLKVQAIPSSAGVDQGDASVEDIEVAAKILAGEVGGVIYFYDPVLDTASPYLNVLVRACNAGHVPLALNEETANLALRAIAKTRTAFLIFNPVAGHGNPEEDLALIRSILEPQMNLNVIMTQKDRDPAEQAKDIITMIKDTSPPDDQPSVDHKFVILGSGGDGTVSAIAGATMNTGIPFGAIPRGTANAFSVALGIPTRVDEACRNILAGHVRIIDGGECNGIPFINLAGVGFEAGLVDNATRELKNVIGNLAYAYGGAKQAIQQEPFNCHIQIDDEEKQMITTKIVTVANVAPPSSVFAQGFGEVIPDDGLFEVTITTGSGTLQELEGLASLYAASIVKTAVPSDNVLRIRAKTITVDCDPPQKLLMDGEVLEANPVTFKIIPNGLSVITPAP